MKRPKYQEAQSFFLEQEGYVNLHTSLQPLWIQPALSFSESRVAVDTVSRRVFPKTWPSSAQTKPLRLCMVAGGSLQRLVSKVSKASLRQWLVSSPLLS